MSNPAVINLAETETDIGLFRIEDNIGESIHLHLGEFRYDLTIKEFLSLSDDLGNVIDGFINVDGFSTSNYSMEFLSRWGKALPDLIRIEYDSIYLEDLIVDTVGFLGMTTRKPIQYSRIVKALNGNTSENDKRDERNFFGETNQQRLNKILESIKKDNYPKENQYIVLFNDSNIIMDGQHRAGCLYHLYGNIKVPVIRMVFKNGKYSDKSNPYLERIYKWDRKRIRHLLRKGYYMMRSFYYKFDVKRISFLIKIDKRRNKV